MTDTRTLPPDPDCCLCHGLGTHLDFPCDCTLVCDCGEERPNSLETCRHPGCTATGCDSCGEIVWCCDPDDEADGDYFCEEHAAT